MAEENKSSLDALSALCKRRGFIYHSSEIYGGMPGFWDYGPLGCELKQNVKQAWWQFTVRGREDVAGLDATIIMHPKIWKASGHLDTFADPMTMCKDCKKLMRADQIKDIYADQKKKPQPKVAGSDFFCPYCGGELTEPKPFNLMFKTVVGPIDDPSNVAYLRPETAQAIFAQFLNVTATSRMTVPYGIAQMGKSFRNEVTPRNYTFRSREFEQMELEFFIRPDEAIELQYGHVVTLADNPDITGPVQDDWGWEVWHKYWVEQRKKFLNAVGLPTEKFVEYWQKPDELAHYARACVDIEYDFPFGRQELEGIAARSDFDLTQHQIHSKVPQLVFDDPLKQACKKLTDEQKAAFIAKTQKEWVERREKALSAKAGKEIVLTEEERADVFAKAKAFCENLFDGKYIPHVIEPSAGVDRLMLALLCEAYEEQKLTHPHGASLQPEGRADQGRHLPAHQEGRGAVQHGARHLPEAPAEGQLHVGRLRRDRAPLPPPGRGGHAVVHHRRRAVHEGRNLHRARARLYGAEAHDVRGVPGHDVRGSRILTFAVVKRSTFMV